MRSHTVSDCFCFCSLLYNREFANYEHKRNINTNEKNLFKTSHVALILNRLFTFVFMFPFMFVIRKLPNRVDTPVLNIFRTVSHVLVSRQRKGSRVLEAPSILRPGVSRLTL